MMRGIKVSKILRVLVFNCTKMRTFDISFSNVWNWDKMDRTSAWDISFHVASQKKIVLSDLVFFAWHTVIYCVGQKVHLGFSVRWDDKPEQTFWPAQYLQRLAKGNAPSASSLKIIITASIFYLPILEFSIELIHFRVRITLRIYITECAKVCLLLLICEKQFTRSRGSKLF